MEKRFGKIINEAFGPVEIRDESEKYVGCRISVETLVGRNYYLYTDGKNDTEQPFVLSVSDLELDGTEEEEPFKEYEDTDDEALDMLLHILDSYSEDEYKAL